MKCSPNTIYVLCLLTPAQHKSRDSFICFCFQSSLYVSQASAFFVIVSKSWPKCTFSSHLYMRFREQVQQLCCLWAGDYTVQLFCQLEWKIRSIKHLIMSIWYNWQKSLISPFGLVYATGIMNWSGASLLWQCSGVWFNLSQLTWQYYANVCIAGQKATVPGALEK